METQLKKGLLDFVVLAVLKRSDSYGYQIVRDVSGVIEISESTLYPILKRLETAGELATYSAEYNGRLRKYYRITDRGRERLAAFTDELAYMSRIYQYIIGE